MSVVRTQGWLDPFSYVGGLFVIFYFIGRALTQQFTTLVYYRDLTESLFRSNSSKEIKLSDRLADKVDQKSIFTFEDVKELWDRYLVHRGPTKISLCKAFLCVCRGSRNKDLYLLRNGRFKMDKALDIRTYIRSV
jgi:hypothetical protein